MNSSSWSRCTATQRKIKSLLVAVIKSTSSSLYNLPSTSSIEKTQTSSVGDQSLNNIKLMLINDSPLTLDYVSPKGPRSHRTRGLRPFFHTGNQTMYRDSFPTESWSLHPSAKENYLAWLRCILWSCEMVWRWTQQSCWKMCRLSRWSGPVYFFMSLWAIYPGARELNDTSSWYNSFKKEI